MDQRNSCGAYARVDGLGLSACHAHATPVLGESVGLDRVRAGDPSRPLVRITVLREGLAIGSTSQPQHVHLDRPWYRLGLFV